MHEKDNGAGHSVMYAGDADVFLGGASVLVPEHVKKAVEIFLLGVLDAKSSTTKV